MITSSSQNIRSELTQFPPKTLTIPSNWVYRISLLYLLIPFLIFCLGFLKTYLSIIITLIFVWLIIRNLFKVLSVSKPIQLTPRTLIFTLLVVFIWVTISGVGGFAFQNIDFHFRNAIFRDLIQFSWPVKYFTNPADPSRSYTLTYYIGFWLPAALIGKIGGWLAANIALYLWTVIGIVLTLLLLASRIKLTPIKIALLMIFFSGMDGLGTLIKMVTVPGTVNLLWPPIYHLEFWAGSFQYSSFTTQLFWVFNQTIPTWLCMALLFVSMERRNILLIWSLCCFFAPLPALGLFPYVILKIPKELIDPENLNLRTNNQNISFYFLRLVHDIRSLLTIDNVLGGGLILGISLLYFLPNAQSITTAAPIKSIEWVGFGIFVLFDGFILWWTVKAKLKANLSWYMAGLLLFVIPLIKIGNGVDFCMRVSIPTLFMLFIWSAETLAAPGTMAKGGLVLLLCIGAITPIYEINRSIYRTTSYLFWPPSTIERTIGEELIIYNPSSYEFDHPFTLTADSYKSLANFVPDQVPNFLTESDHTLFETYLSK